MSQPCEILECKRASRAVCHCCQQNVCIPHLNEHNELLNSQLNPLADEINALSDRLKVFNVEDIVGNCLQKLEQWRVNSYQKIDRFVEQKRHEFDRLVTEKLDKQRQKTKHLQSKVGELIREQEATRQDIQSFTSAVRDLEREMNVIEQTYFQINTRPLMINDSLIDMQGETKKEINPTTFSSVFRTIKRTPHSSCILVSNDRLMLIHQAPNLCFVNTEAAVVKQILWSHHKISGMCWSSVLDRFIVVEENNIFLVDERTMFIENISTIEKQKWHSCTCSDTRLFVSTRVWGTCIVVLSLLPSIVEVRKWKPPVTCAKDEWIDDLVYSKEMLAVIITNETDGCIRIELRSSETLNRVWSLQLKVLSNAQFSFCCCSFNLDEWLVADFHDGSLLYVSKDGKLTTTVPYNGIPYFVNLFGPNMVAVSDEKQITFHKI